MGRSLVIRLAAMLWLLTCGLALPAAAQGSGVRAEAALSSGLVKLGGEVELRVEVHNARTVKVVRVPKLDGIDVIGPGPANQSRYSQRINGRLLTRTTVSWLIVLRPLKTGEYDIPPVEIEIDGVLTKVPKAPLTLKVVEDIRGAELGFLEIESAPARVVEGEPFTLTFVFGWAKELELNSAGLYLPWWSSLPGTLDVARVPSSGSFVRKEITVNRRIPVQIEQAPGQRRGDKDFLVYHLTRRLIASRPGTLQFPRSTFQFSELVARGRGFQPDRFRDFYASLDGFDIEVVPVPEENRPYEWTGAVGALMAERRLDRRDVDAGDSIELEVTWSGNANVEFFDLPDLSRLDAFEGFKVLGVESEHDATSRRATYDLVPLSDAITEVPGVPLWTYVPEEERFVKVTTRSVSIRVRAARGLEALAGTAVPKEVFDVRDIHVDELPSEIGRAPSGKLILSLLLASPLVWFLGRKLARRSGDPDSPLNRRRRRAGGKLARDLRKATNASEQARALASYLGARTREEEHAWLGRNLEDWAAEHGSKAPSSTLMAELEQLQADLDQSSWANADQVIDSARIRGTALRLAKEGL